MGKLVSLALLCVLALQAQYVPSGGGGGGGSTSPGSPNHSVQTNQGGVFTGDVNMLWRTGTGYGTGGMFIGGHSELLTGGTVKLSAFSDQPSSENYFGSTTANDGNPFAEFGYFFYNTTDSSLHDLFYTGSQALLAGPTITDQSWYVESTPDYVAELAARHSLITLRNSTRFCWNNTDDAGLFSAPTPDICATRPAANIIKFTDGASGLGNVQAGSYQESLHTPASSSETCSAGQFVADTNFYYECVSANLWKSAPLLAFGTTLPTFPSGAIVGTTDTQTLTNKSIVATQLTGTIAAARLPNPSSSTLGGTQSATPVSHQWINSISTSGVPALSQPAATDVSGLAASATTDATNASNISSGTLPAAQLPNPGASTLGGIRSYAAVPNQWINTISTSGVPSSTQPAASNLSDGTTGSGAIALATSPTLTTPAITTSTTISNNGIGAADTVGAVLQNTTAAAAGVQQWSPSLSFIGQGWKTAATAVSQAVKMDAYLVPVQESANPDAVLLFRATINGSVATNGSGYFCADGTGGGNITGLFGLDGSPTTACNTGAGFSGFGSVNGASIFGVYTNASVRANFNNNGVLFPSASALMFASSTISNATSGDVTLDRDAAGVLGIQSGAQGTTVANYRDLKLRHELVSGTAPTIASGFGTGPTIAGGDGAFLVTVGTGGVAATGTVTFGTAWSTAPICTANDDSSILAIQPVTTTTTVALTVTPAFGASDKLGVICQGY